MPQFDEDFLAKCSQFERNSSKRYKFGNRLQPKQFKKVVQFLYHRNTASYNLDEDSSRCKSHNWLKLFNQ